MWLRSFINVKKDLEKLVRPKVLEFDEPAFALGNEQRLSGERSDSAGFKFLTLKVYGPHNINTFKGCVVTFNDKSSQLELRSDSKEIKTYYSHSLELGITEFELFLDEEILAFLRRSIESISIQFGKNRLFFEVIDPDKFSLMLK
ncbi:MAG: hypothetical protein ACJASQ_001578 [Crocinitomicaceae bacterium]|jgi:hypothetical protein